MPKTKPKIIIVNNNDKIIGYKERSSLKEDDIYRVSALWITNSKNQILLARRHRSKSHHPGKWSFAVAGTVDEGETYDDNIIKEAEEELGLRNTKPKLGPKIKINNEYHHFTQCYTLKIDKAINEFKIQADEVEEIKWFSPEELKQLLQNQPDEFVPPMQQYLQLFN